MEGVPDDEFCISYPLQKGNTMFNWLIIILIAGWFVMTIINKQYEIDQEDHDFREEV
jgi:hypothetical protein